MLYLFSIEGLSKTELNSDIVLDLKTREKDLYGRIDPSIRHHLSKRGVSIKENVYVGFDTEFCRKDKDHNTLLSAQLAITTKHYVQIPRHTPYTISSLDEKNRVKKLSKHSSVFNYTKLETSIQMCIGEIRRLKYGNYDVTLLKLLESLRLIKGLDYFDDETFTVFSLPRSLVQPYIKICKSFSFKELIQITSGLAKPHVEKMNSTLTALIRDISLSDITIQAGPEEMIKSIQSKYNGYKELEKLTNGFDETLLVLPEGLEVLEDTMEKRLTRKNMNDLFEHQHVSVTKIRMYYLIAHLTQADLSMLSDFDEIKEELSIVNGSFVTLGKPIKFQGRNIHIRDTMLLAPGGSKSLASIGKLYGDVLTKIEISKADLEDMEGFLHRDKDKFTEYALRDALISLIHAS
jgi:hypothetical protein